MNESLGKYILTEEEIRSAAVFFFLSRWFEIVVKYASFFFSSNSLCYLYFLPESKSSCTSSTNQAGLEGLQI